MTTTTITKSYTCPFCSHEFKTEPYDPYVRCPSCNKRFENSKKEARHTDLNSADKIIQLLSDDTSKQLAEQKAKIEFTPEEIEKLRQIEFLMDSKKKQLTEAELDIDKSVRLLEVFKKDKKEKERELPNQKMALKEARKANGFLRSFFSKKDEETHRLKREVIDTKHLIKLSKEQIKDNTN